MTRAGEDTNEPTTLPGADVPMSRRGLLAAGAAVLAALPLLPAPAAAAAAAAPAAPVGAKSVFGSGITSSTSAWPFDQVKGKRAREEGADAGAAAGAAEADEDVAIDTLGDDEDAVPMKRGSKAPPPKQVELLEYADTKAGFSVLIPKDFFKSSRGRKCASNDKLCQTQRGKDLGTLFVSGNLQTAQIVSIQRLSIEQLLKDVGVLPTGDLSTWQAIGTPQKVAQLLASFRDGDSKQSSGIPSKLAKGSAVQSEDDLTFSIITPIAVQRPDELMQQQGLTELRRITSVRAVLQPDTKEVMIVWASALEQDWVNGAKEVFSKITDSFQAFPGA